MLSFGVNGLRGGAKIICAVSFCLGLERHFMLNANLISGGLKIHEKAQGGNEPLKQFATNFLTAYKRLC